MRIGFTLQVCTIVKQFKCEPKAVFLETVGKAHVEKEFECDMIFTSLVNLYHQREVSVRIIPVLQR